MKSDAILWTGKNRQISCVGYETWRNVTQPCSNNYSHSSCCWVHTSNPEGANRASDITFAKSDPDDDRKELLNGFT